jgi:hypothetical protein
MASAAPVEDQVLTPSGAEDAGGGDSGKQMSEVERLASEMGWDPNYQPPAGKEARSAVDWIKSTNANNRNLKREVKDLKVSIERIASVADKQVKREVQERAQEIQARFEAAVENKDTAGAAKAVKDLRELEADNAPASAGNDVEADFARENPWYGSDEDATAYAISVSQREAKKGNTDPAKQLAAVKAAVEKRFPELFEAKPAPKPQAAVHEPGTRATGGRGGTAYADMPKAAKDACDRFYAAAKGRGRDVDEGKFRAQYAKDYFDTAAA